MIYMSWYGFIRDDDKMIELVIHLVNNYPISAN